MSKGGGERMSGAGRDAAGCMDGIRMGQEVSKEEDRKVVQWE